MFEALGPARFIGWARGGEIYRDPWGLGFEYVYEAGEPMGGPVLAPFVRCLATEETQVGNVYATIYYNLTDEDAPLFYVPGVDAGVEKILLPQGGEIRASTASGSAKDGGKETFAIFDETHLYTTPELRRMYNTVTRNMRKRKLIAGTWYLETTTMFAPGEESVAEATFAEAEALREARKKKGRHRLLYDHRWGVVKDLTDEPLLREALREAYGDAMLWIDLDGLIDEFYDTRKSAADSRRYFLNAQTSTSDAWLAAHEWEACARPDRSLKKGELVCLGLDGSIRDDSTALVAISLTGHIQLIGCWEKPAGPEGENWQVDREDVDAVLSEAMKYYRVVGFYADPAHWMDSLSRWHNEYSAKMKVKASAARPLEWWTNRPRAMVSALERLHEAVLEERVSYTPAADRVGREAELALVLTRHFLNTRRAPSRSGLQVRKEHPHSSRKIDATVATCLAYAAVGDALAAGVGKPSNTAYAARRIR